MNRGLVIIGVVVLILGLLASAYVVTTSEEHFWGLFSTTESTTPYGRFSIPLVIGGIILILVGAFVGKKSE